LADRLNKYYTDNSFDGPSNRWTLSAQQILNCGVGSCHEGGSAAQVYSFIQKNGVVQWGCQVYTASSPPFYDRTCSNIQQCATCWPDGSLEKSKCVPVKKYQKVMVSEWGAVKGVKDMMNEIYNRGPIACGIMVTNELYNKYPTGYDEGIFTDNSWRIDIDHEIAVVGWGTSPKGVRYWVIRNSWGTMWGLNGYLKLKMGDNTIGIESGCNYAVPSVKTVYADSEPLPENFMTE
jgi:cathepsin X